MQRMLDRMSGKKVLLMKNHGFMTVGANVAEAFYYAFNLEVACRAQLAAAGTDADLDLPDDETARIWSADYQTTEHHQWDGAPQWHGFLRKLDRENPGYEK